MLLPQISSLLHRPVECVGSCMSPFSFFSFPICLVWTNVISIREFTSPSFPVYMYDADGAYKVMTMGEVSIQFDSSVLPG